MTGLARPIPPAEPVEILPAAPPEVERIADVVLLWLGKAAAAVAVGFAAFVFFFGLGYWA